MKKIINNNKEIMIIGELWPYGLKKAGVNTNKYLKLLKKLKFNVNVEDPNLNLKPQENNKKYYTDFIAYKNETSH